MANEARNGRKLEERRGEWEDPKRMYNSIAGKRYFSTLAGTGEVTRRLRQFVPNSGGYTAIEIGPGMLPATFNTPFKLPTPKGVGFPS